MKAFVYRTLIKWRHVFEYRDMPQTKLLVLSSNILTANITKLNTFILKPFLSAFLQTALRLKAARKKRSMAFKNYIRQLNHRLRDLSRISIEMLRLDHQFSDVSPVLDTFQNCQWFPLLCLSIEQLKIFENSCSLMDKNPVPYYIQW